MSAGLNRPARYGAVAAKVRRLWGLRLREEDYRRMAALRTLPEAAAYLRAHPRWGRALEGVNVTDIHRFALEEHLRRFHGEERMRLHPYLEAEDRALLDFPAPENMPAQNPSAPPLAEAEADFYSRHFRSQLALIRRYADAGARKYLTETIGMQADWRNIAVIVRVKRYYPEMEGQILRYLLPFYHAIRPVALKQMMAAKDADAAVHVLRGTRYGKYVQGWSASEGNVPIERVTAQIRRDHSLRALRQALPSIAVPLAFLHLTDMELSSVIHIIECVRYGLSPEDAMGYIV